MQQTFHTLIYAAPRLEVDELMQVRQQLCGLLGEKEAKKAETDDSCINKIVSINSSHNLYPQILENINLKIPEEGEKIKRLIEIAKERNIEYKPSTDASYALNAYVDRKGIPHPLNLDTVNKNVVSNMNEPPQYNPH